jgi:surfeit locus 1 family protein
VQRIKTLPLLVFLGLLALLISLGFWQLNRAEEKRQLIVLQTQRQQQELINLTATSPDDLELLLYTKVHVTGSFDNNHQFLLDNQIQEGRAGYYVLTPLRVSNSTKAILVNRGWLPVGAKRTDLPDISVGSLEISLVGIINRFPSPGIKLAGAEIPGKIWPAVIQVIDTQVLAKHLGYDLFSFQVELDKSAPLGYVREWKHTATMPPEKHLAYAGQWFLLALTLTVLFLKFGIRKNKA